MPKIPLFQFSPQSAGPSNVRADPGMLNQQYAAAARVGQAVAGLGDVAEQVAVRLQRANNYRQLTALDMAMEEEWHNFENSRNPSTDETKWVGDWQKQLDGRISKMVPKDAGPQLKQELQLRAQAFRVRTSGDVGHQAKGVSVEKGRKIGLTRNEQLWDNGNAAGAEANLNQMADLGLIFREEIPGLMAKGQTYAERNDALRLINTDPIKALDVLDDRTEGGKPRNFSHLDEADRYGLITQAERNAAQLRTGTYEQLAERMNNGELLTKAELDGLVERKLLTATQSKSIIRQQGAGKLDTGAFSDLSSRILNYDRTADVSRKDYAGLFAEALAFPGDARAALLADLNAKDKPDHVLNSPVAQEAFKGIKERFDLGIYGKFQTRKYDEKTNLWSTVVNPAAFENAMIARRRIEDATRRYLEANPQATAGEVNQFVYETARGARLKSIWAPSINPLSGKTNK